MGADLVLLLIVLFAPTGSPFLLNVPRTSRAIVCTIGSQKYGTLSELDAVGKTFEPFTTSVVTKSDVLPVCILRNKFVTPSQMILDQEAENEMQKERRLKSALEGVGAGFLVGALIGFMSAFDSVSGDKLESGLRAFGTIGPISGAFIGINNAMGRRVFIMTEGQAENRLLVDFAGGLGGGDDGVVARVGIGDAGGAFDCTEGIFGVLDLQIRQRGKYGALPNHLHLKNMFVAPKMRRKGAARGLLKKTFQLLERDEKYASIECITLEVEDSNVSAIALYESEGFVRHSIGTVGSKAKYGSFVLGRSIMIRDRR